MAKSFVALSLIVLTIALIYSNHFENSFHFDDFHTIHGNPYILKLENIPRFYWDVRTFSSMPTHQSYRPLVTTTLALDYALGNKIEPFYFHVTNFSCFILVVICVYLVTRKILLQLRPSSLNDSLALLAAAFYGLHTANAETVNYIISRSDILSALCHMLTFVLYFAGGSFRRFHLYAIPGAIGMCAKESSLMVAPVFVAYLYLIEEGCSLTEIFTRKGIRSMSRSIIRSLPLTLVCGVLAVLSMKLAVSYRPGGTSPLLYAMTQPYVIMLYAKTFFLPTHLSADTDVSLVSGLSDSRFWIGLSFLVALLAITFAISRNREGRPIAFGIVWFLLVLAPTSSVIPLAEVLNDHRTFLPYVGLTIALIAGISNLTAQKEYLGLDSRSFRFPALLLGAVVLVSMGYGTRQRNEIWKTEESLWKDVTEKSPGNGRGWMNYGLTQMSQGKYLEAEASYQQALRLTPFYDSLHINLGILRNAMGLKKEAEQSFRFAVGLNTREIEPFYYFATFLRKEKRYSEARVHIQNALHEFPAHLASLHELMEISRGEGNIEELRRAAEQTLNHHPDDARAQRVLHELRQGVLPLAVNDVPLTADHYVDESRTYYETENYESAIEAARRALTLRANYPEAHNNICSALVQLRRFDEAIVECQRALAIFPEFNLAKNNLRWAETEKAKLD